MMSSRLKCCQSIFKVNPRFFSNNIIDYQPPIKNHEEWKENSNFVKNFWNRQSFGRIKRKKGYKSEGICVENNRESELFWVEKMICKNRDLEGKKKGSDYRRMISESASSITADQINELSSKFEKPDVGSDAIKSRPTPLKNRKKGPNSSSFSTISLKRDFASDPNCVSVTKVLKETMPVERRIGLQKWEERMIAEMGKENFLKMQESVLLRGKRLHSCIETFFLTGELDYQEDSDPVLKNQLKSLTNVIERFERPVLSLESQVIHPHLNYHGYTDCVAKLTEGENSRLVIIDWKTSQREKSRLSDTFDTPIQIAAYAGALNHDERYPFQVWEGAAVIVYSNGFSAKLLPISNNQLNYYWGLWLLRLKLFREMENSSKAQTVKL